LVETLLALLRPLLDRVAEREAPKQQLRDESALLEGQTPRPPLRPRILSAPAPTNAETSATSRRRGQPTQRGRAGQRDLGAVSSEQAVSWKGWDSLDGLSLFYASRSCAN